MLFDSQSCSSLRGGDMTGDQNVSRLAGKVEKCDLAVREVPRGGVFSTVEWAYVQGFSDIFRGVVAALALSG